MVEKVRLADEPAENAPTFAQLIADAEVAGSPWIDDYTPEGHFGVTVKNIGGFGVYWFKGELGDSDARVVGRTQNGHHYVGGGILGGTWVGR